ncbi:MAG: SprT family zinc-dependent metalloprotease [Rhizobiaceae bacterium]|nr:SprT family zinc-dependent metalloprotease [Rhizobiaceae bacterium]
MEFSFFRQLQKRDRDFEIEVEGNTLPVKVVENDRAKRITLRIVPGGDGLRVTTPGHVGDDEIEAFVERNRNWVTTRLARLPGKVNLEAGAFVPYLGVDHKIVPTGKLRGIVSVKSSGNGPELHVPGDEKTISRRLLTWLKQEARRELNEAVARHVSKIGVRPKQIRITDTTSRWGSCSSTRTLSFSWRIIMAPPEVLDYLAAHEVAHLIEMNHSDRFWRLTRDLCPDTDRQKNWLRQNGAKLHAVNV